MSPQSMRAVLIGRGLCIVAIVGYGTRGVAAPESGQAEPGAKEAAKLPASESQLAEAKELFTQAEKSASGGNYAEALQLMQKSYALSQYPWLQFNLGLLHEKLGHCRAAIESYEEYLKSVPDGTRRPEAEAYIQAAGPTCALASVAGVEETDQPASASSGAVESSATPLVSLTQRSPSPTSSQVPGPRDEPERPYWTTQRTVGVSALSGGVLAALGAVYFGWSAAQHADDLTTASRAARALPPEERPSWTGTAQPIAEARDADRTRAIVLSGLSGALLGAGAFLFLSSPSSTVTARARQGLDAASVARSLEIRVSADRVVAECTALSF